MENGTQTPDIYQISWATSSNFDEDLITVSPITTKSAADMYDRSKIMYQYQKGAPVRDLVLTVPRKPDAYITCRGVQKDVFTKGEHKIETNKYGAQFVLDADNPHHIALYETFAKVIAKLTDLTGATVTFPIKDMDGYSILYTNLIHSNDGRMFSSAYTAEEQLDILEVRKSKVRPAFLLSAIKNPKTPKEMKIRVQVSQMYIHEEIRNFPLATRD